MANALSDQTDSPMLARRPNGVRRWFGRGAWAIVDQGLFAGANFAVNLVLAAWMSKAEYGTFAVGFALLWLLGAGCVGFFIEPMLVFGAGRFRPRRRAYLKTLIQLYLVFSVVVGVCIAAAGGVSHWLGATGTALVLWSMAIAAPLVILTRLVRQATYLWMKPHLAAFAGGVYLVGCVVGAWAMSATGELSAAVAMLLLGGASLIAIGCVAAMALLGSNASRQGGVRLRHVLARHWGYGRWSVPSEFLVWVPTQSFYVFAAMLGSVELECRPACHGQPRAAGPAGKFRLGSVALTHPRAGQASGLVPASLLCRRGRAGWREFSVWRPVMGVWLILGITGLCGEV